MGEQQFSFTQRDRELIDQGVERAWLHPTTGPGSQGGSTWRCMGCKTRRPPNWRVTDYLRPNRIRCLACICSQATTWEHPWRT